MKTKYILSVILGICLLFAPTFNFADESSGKVEQKIEQIKTEKQENKDKLEDGEVRLIYPAEAINYSTSDETYAKKPAKPPVSEEEDAEYDVETPIGQVRKIRDSLEQIKKDQRNAIDLLEDFQGCSNRTDEILNAIGRIPSPIDRTNDLLSAFEQRFEEVQAELESVVDKKFQETNDAIKTQLDTVVDAFETSIDQKLAETELKTSELIDEKINLVKDELTSSIEIALDSAFNKALENASEKLNGVNFVPPHWNFVVFIIVVNALVVCVLVVIMIIDKILSRREKTLLRMKQEAKNELLADIAARQQKQKAATAAKQSNQNGTVIEG